MKSLSPVFLMTLTCLIFCSATLSGLASEATPTPEASEALEATPTPEAWRLRYQFRAGQALRLQTRQTATLEAMAGENRKTDKSEVEHRQLMKVVSVDDDGRAHVTLQFEHVRMLSQTDDLPPSVFESSMKPEEIPTRYRETAARLKGPAVRFTLYPTGNGQQETSETPPTSGTSDGSRSAGSGTAGSSEKAQAGFLMPLPTEEVRIGDTWKDTQSVKVRVTKDINRKIEILRSFCLVSVENGIAQISFNSSITSPVTHPGVRAQLMQSTPRGTLSFDIARGVMLRKGWKFDQSVINAMGENTVVTSWGEFSEELMESENPPGADAQASAAVDASPVAEASPVASAR